MEKIPIALEEVIGRVAARDIVDPSSKEVLVQCNEEISLEQIEQMREMFHDLSSGF